MCAPKHTGVEGNEKADALPKAGESTPFISPEPVFGISRQRIIFYCQAVYRRREKLFGETRLGIAFTAFTHEHLAKKPDGIKYAQKIVEVQYRLATFRKLFHLIGYLRHVNRKV